MTAQQSAAAEGIQEFRPPYDTETLRVLQGRACRDCKTLRSALHPAGQAVTVGPSGDRITWDVRRCAKCRKAKG